MNDPSEPNVIRNSSEEPSRDSNLSPPRMSKQKYEDPLASKQRQYEQFSSAQAQTASSKKQSFQNFHDPPYPASPIRQPFGNMDQPSPSAQQMPGQSQPQPQYQPQPPQPPPQYQPQPPQPGAGIHMSHLKSKIGTKQDLMAILNFVSPPRPLTSHCRKANTTCRPPATARSRSSGT